MLRKTPVRPSTRAETSPLVLVRRFLPYLYDIRWLVVVVSVLILVSPLLSILLLWLMKTLIDDVFVGRHTSHLASFAAVYIGIVFTKLLLTYIGTRTQVALTERLAQNIRVDLYRHLITISPGSLHSLRIGDQIAHLSGDVGYIEFLVYTGPLGLLRSAITAIYYGAFLIFLSWQLTLCALLVAPPLALISLRMAPRSRRVSRISRRRSSDLLSITEERLNAIPIIHAFMAQSAETARYDAACTNSRRAELRNAALQAWQSLLTESAAALGGLAVLAVGAYEAAQGAMTTGALMAFFGSVGSLYAPVSSLSKSSTRFQRASVGAQRVVNLLDRPSLVAESPSAKPLRRVRGALEFRDVRFAYPGGGAQVLHGVSFRAEPGETVAIVGPNGSGKSTLIRLALRLYDPSAGAVLLDGVDLRDITLASLRQAMGVVFQEPHVFRGSIRNNIRYGRPEASPAQIAEAAEAAHVDTFARGMRGGYSAPVGPNGNWLSGGQRQRLALARAFIREAPILLLDEAMASVDSEAEEFIQEAIERFAGRRTIVIVGHRLATVHQADRAVVLDEGRVVEIGAPGALLGGDSRYRDLFAAQIMPGKVPA